MKGTVFVELLKMAEGAFGEDVVDNVLDKADLDNNGAFTSVGNYPCSELIKIVEAFSEHSGISPEELQRKFGHWMLDRFGEGYPEFFKDKTPRAYARLVLNVDRPRVGLVTMREELIQLWQKSSATKEQLVKQLEDWCRRAELSGIAALQDFSRTLRRYAV